GPYPPPYPPAQPPVQASPVIIQHHHYYNTAPGQVPGAPVEARGFWAEVTDAIPIMGRRVPGEQCWNEQVPVYDPGHPGSPVAGSLAGGVVGGALGHSLGYRSDHRNAITVVGAMLGASVGHDLASQPQPPGYRYITQTRCAPVMRAEEISYGPDVIGYRVYYRHDGYIHETRSEQRPGERIWIAQ
ncbi:MAG: glycine zipper 2TM domain-containing protein, partial [Gammaproteobacteria bacterium]|nr:glycine zipper 2TM domain-containing protein [Gammaproteobacteria bacterium]